MSLTIRNLSPSDAITAEATLWKYLSFEKFLDFLLMKRMYFRRVDKLGDPYECLMPPGVRERAGQDARRQDLERYYEDYSRYVDSEREKVFVNCWHANDYESEAMWKLFGGPGHSIAITSTVARLVALVAPYGVAAGKVQYKDMLKDGYALDDIFDFALLKRKPFEHEREFRLVYINRQDAHNPKLLDAYGLHVPADPMELIERIYVSPLSEPWQFELSQTIIKGQGLADRMIKSTLFNTPADPGRE
jgi:hypothetical protein